MDRKPLIDVYAPSRVIEANTYKPQPASGGSPASALNPTPTITAKPIVNPLPSKG